MTTEPYVPDAARWDAFVEWARRFYEWVAFAESERDYKLEIGEWLAAAREAFLNDSPDWVERLRVAVKHRDNNLTYGGNWRLGGAFLDLVESDSPLLREGLHRLWGITDSTAQARVRGFVESVAETPLGVPESMASFLLMARGATRHPFYASRPFGRAYRFTGHPRPARRAERWEQYGHAVAFLDEFIGQAKDRGLDIRDRLDAQSLVWCVTRPDYMPEEWTQEALDALEAYRESGGQPAGARAKVAEQARTYEAEGAPTGPEWPVVAARLLWDRRQLEEIVADLEDKKQMIFYGLRGPGRPTSRRRSRPSTRAAAAASRSSSSTPPTPTRTLSRGSGRPSATADSRASSSRRGRCDASPRRPRRTLTPPTCSSSTSSTAATSPRCSESCTSCWSTATRRYGSSTVARRSGCRGTCCSSAP